MAQDKRKALDEKTRKLSSGRIENGKEHSTYQEAQQQLLAIQAEQQQNLAVARAESKASFENNQTLAQAAELEAISAAEAEQMAQVGGQVNLNPATQSVLNKYGVGQPKFSRTQSHSQQVTKQNITINNNVTSNTTNDVKVPGGVGGPLQGRPLQFKSPAQDSTGKFKAWISSAFARQNEEGARRDREYRNRENSLTRSANKMMKKLEDVGKTIGTRMDPRKIGSTWQSQLKTLLLLFGFGYLTSNWTKILDTVSGIEMWVKNTYNYFAKGEFADNFKKFIGGKDNEPLLKSVSELFIGNDGLLGRLKDYFKNIRDDRKSALSLVKFPDIDFEDMIGTIKGVGEYLGNILTAIVSGTEGTQSIITNQIKTASNKGAFEQISKDSATRDSVSHRTQSNKVIKADKGIEALMNESYSGLTRYSIDDNGNLTNQAFGAEATVAQANDISRIFDLANHGKGIKSTELAAGLQRLFNAAKIETEGGNGVPVTIKFIKNWFNDGEIKNLQTSKNLRKVNYYAVARKKTVADFALENADPLTRSIKAGTNQYLFNNTPVVGNAAKNIKIAEGTGAGAAIGTLFGMPFVGAAVGGAVGWAASTPEYQAVSEYLKGTINQAAANDYRVEYVREPRPGDEIITDPKTGEPVKIPLWEISDKTVQKLTDKITGKENTNININDREFVTSVQTGLQKSSENEAANLDKLIREKEEYRRTHPQDYSNNLLLSNLREYRSNLRYQNVDDYDINAAYDLRDKFNKEREDREKSYEEKHSKDRWATLSNNSSDLAYDITNGAVGTHSETLTAGKSVDSKTLEDRKKYLIKLLRNEGLSDGAIAGIIGNLENEGLSKPTNQRVPDPPGSGKFSMGIAQFNSGGELPSLQAWAKKNGLDYTTFEAQAKYIANHKVIDKILRETHGLNPQDSLKKAAIIWGHDFERFVGYNAADSKGNLIGKGSYISVPVKSKDKYRDDGKLYGDENYTERIQKGLNTYNTYVGSDLSDITVESSRSFRQDENEKSDNKEEEESFISILGKHIKEFIFSMGGLIGKANEKIEEVTSPILDGAKKAIFKNGKKYGGPITDVFTSYESYLANQDSLPDGLSAGLSYADWKNNVYDMTGSMPGSLDVEMSTSDYRTKQILNKYSKRQGGEEAKADISTESPKVENIEIASNENALRSIFDTETYKKNDERIRSIDNNISYMAQDIGKLVSIGSITGELTARVGDAVNNNTVVSANSTRQLAQANQVRDKNSTGRTESLRNKPSNEIV